MFRQCTECDSSSSEDGEMKVDPNDNTPLIASRQKRSIKEPSKFIPGKDVSIIRTFLHITSGEINGLQECIVYYKTEVYTGTFNNKHNF